MKYLIASALFVLSVTGAAIHLAHANPYFVAPNVSTSAATTSPAFLAVGTASSTLTYDANGNPPGINKLAEGATFLVQYTGSSTSAILNVAFQYSQDGIDWYDDSVNVATTSSPANVTVANSYNVTATTNLGKKAISLETPVRYVRANLTVTGANASVWAQFVPKRQLAE